MERGKSDSSSKAVWGAGLLSLLIAAGCMKADLPPERIAVDVMAKCVKGDYERLDGRVAGDAKNFILKDGEMRKKGRGWFPAVKEASFSVVDVKVEEGVALVRLKALLDGKAEEMPVRLEKSTDGRWRVFSFSDNKTETTK